MDSTGHPAESDLCQYVATEQGTRPSEYRGGAQVSGMKIYCYVCHIEKDETEFSMHHGRKNGRQSGCKECRVAERAKFMAMVQQLKLAPCTDCGKTLPHYVMEFDHRETGHSRAIAAFGGDGPAFRIELAKCDLVCGNCHNERTWLRRQQ